MSHEESTSPTDQGQSARTEKIPGADVETPVGDMFAEGQTEIGPHPSLTHIENLEQADLPAAAEAVGEAKSSPAE